MSRRKIYCCVLMPAIVATTIFAGRGYVRRTFYEYVAAQEANDWKQKMDEAKRKHQEAYLEMLIETATPLEYIEPPAGCGRSAENDPVIGGRCVEDDNKFEFQTE